MFSCKYRAQWLPANCRRYGFRWPDDTRLRTQHQKGAGEYTYFIAVCRLWRHHVALSSATADVVVTSWCLAWSGHRQSRWRLIQHVRHTPRPWWLIGWLHEMHAETDPACDTESRLSMYRHCHHYNFTQMSFWRLVSFSCDVYADFILTRSMYLQSAT